MNKLIKRVLVCLFVIVVLGLGFFQIRRNAYLPKEGSPQTIQHDAPSIPTRLFLLADTGTGDEDQLKVAEAMEKRCQAEGAPAGIFLLGDLFYMHGVKSAEDQQWHSKLEVPYRSSPCLAKVPLYLALGNHDYKGNVTAFVEYAKHRENIFHPNRFYTVKYSRLLSLSVFDSAFPDLCFLPQHCSIDYLRKSLQESEAKWKLVLSHHPLMSSSAQGYSHSGEGILGYALRNMFCGKANAWISGHAHHLEFREPADCKTATFIVGGGGGTLTEIRQNDPDVRFIASAHGFLELMVTYDSLQASFIGVDTTVLHSTNFRL